MRVFLAAAYKFLPSVYYVVCIGSALDIGILNFKKIDKYELDD